MGEKRKINGWLIDQDFLDKVEFHDLYYFNSLTRHIHDFILNCPTPLSTYWDKNLSTIFFMVGDKKFGFKVDSDISYYDYITLVERDLKKFYPKYECKIKVERHLTEDEILEKREEAKEKKVNFNLEEWLNKKTIEEKIERGIITKIFIKKDEFIINIDDKLYIYITWEIPLSKFLEKLRRINEDESLQQVEKELEKRNFILSNSKKKKDLIQIDNSTDYIPIKYCGRRMVNFFNINFQDLKEEELIPFENKRLVYQWGKYRVFFESDLLKEDCLRLYDSMIKN